ncbi:hypothetical protein BHE74_00017959 [Ensete ventricosum]|nr:hypothetical protein BHE74_00017959 [Ensete ventricosum]
MASAGFVLLPLTLLLLSAARCAHAQPSPPPSDNYSPYFGPPSFNRPTAIVIVFLVSAFFLVGFVSIYIRHCAGPDPRGPVAGAVARSRRLPWQQQQHSGLSPEVFETFPTLVYSEVMGLQLGKGVLKCAVCLSEFEDDDALRLLPRCNHAFHPDCIDTWLTSHVTCPVCRSNLAEAADTEPPPVVFPALEAPVPPPQGREEEALPTPPSPAGQTTIVVGQEDKKDELAQIERLKREVGSRSGRRPPKLPRSHSTGHLVVLPGENVDRYTLWLPEHVRKEIFAAQNLHRSTSCDALPTAAEVSSRRGYRSTGIGGGGAGEGSSRGGRSVRLGRSDRWPSFLIRSLSMKVPAWATGRRADGGDESVKKGVGECSSSGKFATVRTPFNCLVAIGDDDESSAAALAGRVEHIKF